jgi:hypothetical protein
MDIVWVPEGDRSVYGEFLKTRGEGIHHITLCVPNWDEMVSILLKKELK